MTASEQILQVLNSPVIITILAIFAGVFLLIVAIWIFLFIKVIGEGK